MTRFTSSADGRLVHRTGHRGTHRTLTEQGVNGQWSLVASPNQGPGEDGLAGIAAIPGGGLWAVGIAEGNHAPSTLIEFHH